jgi:hypothetical protein
VLRNANESNGNVVIGFDTGQELTLVNVGLGALHADDFLV